ncbi:MAG TPA: 3-isopropylmalate dehydratase small subunit [Methylomirabilota bacterium]|jgi:3-isopropylmalate/(R)-2-methylmalate dehydratase small subunit
MSATSERRQVVGRGIPLPGNDIDTDRIIPARYLKSVTFAGLGEHVFGDERKAVPEHPFNRPQYQGASVLIAGQNFGCGSSREHAPVALRDWGVRGIVAGSYGEIFFGNCTANGMPCLVADPGDLDWLLREVEKHPREGVELDVERQEVRFMGRTIRARIPEGARNQLVTGSWNAVSVLLEAGDAIERTARALPYVSGY